MGRCGGTIDTSNGQNLEPEVDQVRQIVLGQLQSYIDQVKMHLAAEKQYKWTAKGVLLWTQRKCNLVSGTQGLERAEALHGDVTNATTVLAIIGLITNTGRHLGDRTRAVVLECLNQIYDTTRFSRSPFTRPVNNNWLHDYIGMIGTELNGKGNASYVAVSEVIRVIDESYRSENRTYAVVTARRC